MRRVATRTIFNSDGSVSIIYDNGIVPIKKEPPKIEIKKEEPIIEQKSVIKNSDGSIAQPENNIQIISGPEQTKKETKIFCRPDLPGYKHKVLYLGGFFQAEYSMRLSFLENGIDIRFLLESQSNVLTRKSTNNFNHSIIDIVDNDELELYVKAFVPDVIIHRCYMNNLVAYHDAYSVAKKLNIPYCKYIIETCEEDLVKDNRFDNCDFVLYAHNTKATMDAIEKIKNKNSYLYMYGVGPAEKIISSIPKDLEIAGFGYARRCHPSRIENFKYYASILKTINKDMHVFGTGDNCTWSIMEMDNLIVHPGYNLEDTTEVMNSCKIAINYESIADLDGAYSHKMFQTLGCGIPTITKWKPSLEKLFGKDNGLLLINDEKDVIKTIKYYLKNEKERKKLGDKAEKFIHANFDWYKNFEKIMIEEGIWKINTDQLMNFIYEKVDALLEKTIFINKPYYDDTEFLSLVNFYYPNINLEKYNNTILCEAIALQLSKILNKYNIKNRIKKLWFKPLINNFRLEEQFLCSAGQHHSRLLNKEISKHLSSKKKFINFLNSVIKLRELCPMEGEWGHVIIELIDYPIVIDPTSGIIYSQTINSLRSGNGIYEAYMLNNRYKKLVTNIHSNLSTFIYATPQFWSNIYKIE